MLGLGAALGAGIVLLSRLEPVRTLLRLRGPDMKAHGQTAPTTLQIA